MHRFQAILLGCAFLLVSAVAGKAADEHHVLLVHGIHDDGSSMMDMADAFWKKGVVAHVPAYTPSNGHVGLDELAQQIASYVDREMPGVRRFDVVAFSMGGLVSRYYIQNLGGAKRVGKFIQISAPNHGTWDAFLLWNAGGRQMRPGSDFLNALNANLNVYKSIPWLTVRTPLDITIVPSASTEMAEAKNLRSWVLFHPLMVSDKHVIKIVVDSLTQPAKK